MLNVKKLSNQVTEGQVLTDVIEVSSDSPGSITFKLNSDDFTIDPNPLIVPNLKPGVPIFFSITSKDDFVIQGDRNVTVYFTVSSSHQSTSQGFQVTIKDNDTAGIIITETLGNTAVTEGGATDSYSVVLTSQPTANVTVNLNGEEQLSFNTTTLTFTPDNWNVAQAVTVTAVDDGLIEGNHTQTISHTATSADANYGGISISSVNVNITDNDNNLDMPSRLTTKDDDIFNITGDDTKAILQVTLLGRNSNLVNELGVFIVDDATGTINGIAPSANGYAQAALKRAQVVGFYQIADENGGIDTNGDSKGDIFLDSLVIL